MRKRPAILLMCLWAVLANSASSAQTPEVTISVRTASGDSILTPGEPIIWTMDAGDHEVLGLGLPMYVYFTNRNLLGPLVGNENLVASDKAIAAFEHVSLNEPLFGCNPAYPVDSLRFGCIDFGGEVWTGSGELFRIISGPTDTGTIRFVATDMPPHDLYVNTVAQGTVVPAWDGPTLIVQDAPGSSQTPIPSVRVRTHSGRDTLYANGPSQLIFSVDPKVFELTEVTFAGVMHFTNGNIIGPLTHTENFTSTPLALAAYELRIWNDEHGMSATDPDTIAWKMTDFSDTIGLSEAGDLAVLNFVPLDTGSFTLDTALVRSTDRLSYTVGQSCRFVEADWEASTIHVIPCPVLMGDCNEDGIVTSADIIWYVNYMFKSGPDPLPMRTVGDVNCSGGLSGADIIYLVNYFFKSGPEPCGCYVRVI